MHCEDGTTQQAEKNLNISSGESCGFPPPPPRRHPYTSSIIYPSDMCHPNGGPHHVTGTV